MTFPERIERLRKALGGLSAVAEAMGVSRQTLYAALEKPEDVSEKTLRKLATAELSNLTDEPMALSETQAPYGETPSRAQIEARVKAFLDAAERVPGGLGYASVQVGLHLDPSRLMALDPAHAGDALTRLRHLAAGVARGEAPTRKAG